MQRIAILILMTFSLLSQDDETAIKKVITKMFDGFRQSDTTLVAPAYYKDINSFTAFTNKKGEHILRRTDRAKVKQAIAKPKDPDKYWDERLYNWTIKIDGPIAMVWVDYSFYIGKNFSHCGVNSYQMFKTSEGWQIFNMVDTRRRNGCETH